MPLKLTSLYKQRLLLTVQSVVQTSTAKQANNSHAGDGPCRPRGFQPHNIPDFDQQNLRPEIALGQFLNFKLLHAMPIPFASTSIGKTYRNEISSVDPVNYKKHPRFRKIEDCKKK